MQAYQDGLTRAATAFASFGELMMAIAGGYGPTIYPDTRRKALLRRMLVGMGVRVYPYRTFPSDRR